MRSIGRFLATAAAALALLGTPAFGARKSFGFGQWGGISLDVPDGWTAVKQGEGTPGGFAIRVEPAPGGDLVLLVTPIPYAGSQDLPIAVREVAEGVREKLRTLAVEKDLPIRELKGAHCEGRYVSATDRTVEHPSPGNYRYVDQGAAATGTYFMTFTILTNDATGPHRTVAREIVASAAHVLPGAPWRNPDGSVVIAFPGRPVKLRLSLPGFIVDPLTPKRDEPGVRLAARHPGTGVVVTAFLERSPEGWTAARHREEALALMQAGDGMKRDNLRRSERNGAAILEYEVKEFRGEAIRQRSMNAYLVKDGVWIDVHVSKTGFKPEDQAQLDAVIDSVRLEE